MKYEKVRTNSAIVKHYVAR